MKTRMKIYTLLYILLLPVLAICQSDSLSFNFTVHKDSSLNFSSENLDFLDYMESQIDNSIERGFFPREKVIVRCPLLTDGKLSSIIPFSENPNLTLEVVNALNNIKKITLAEEFDESQFELILIVERWKEIGDFDIRGLLIARDNKNTNNVD